MSRVDVVIPCYDYGCYLSECVESVLAQSLRDIRVMIIDDASPDDTPEVAARLVAQDSRVCYVRHATNRGHIATYNEGLLEWATAEYALLLSADDYLLPGALARAVALMDYCPQVGFTFGPAIELHPGSPPPRLPSETPQVGAVILDGVDFIELSGVHNIVSTASVVVRTALQRHLGGYRPEFPHAGDMEMWFRFAVHGKVGRIAAPQAVYRRHQRNMSLSYFANRKLVLPDLQQRVAVFTVLFSEHADRLPDILRLKARTLKLLAEEALWEAHAAFENSDLQACHDFAALAAATHPAVKHSRPWITLALKRRLGLRMWEAVARLSHI